MVRETATLHLLKLSSPVKSHFVIIIILQKRVKISEVNIAINSHFAPVEYHQDEDELCKLVIFPLLLLVEVLKYAMDQKIDLNLLVHH